MRLGRELRVPMFVGSIVQQLYSYAAGKVGGEFCHTAIIKFFEDWAGVRVTSKEGG